MQSLTREQYKTLALSSLGGVLEFYDFIIFVYFTSVIGTLFFSPEMPDWLRQLQTYGLFAVGYFCRPLGGIIMAHFGDIKGRKKVFIFSIFLMTIPTFAIGFMPTYSAIGIWAPILLLVCRMMQGAAIGGEAPGAWVFVAEHVNPRHVGFACASLTAGLTGGIFIGAIITTFINSYFTQVEILSGVWRYPFIIGGVFGLIAFFLRQQLQETPVFKSIHKKLSKSEIPLKQVFKFHKSSVFISALISWVLAASIVTMILMTPSLLQKLFKVPAQISLQANIYATFFLTFGCLAFGFLADYFGRTKVFAIGCLGLIVTSILLYQQIDISYENILFFYSLNGFFVGVIGIIPSIAAMSFPPKVRFSGLSFSYNVTYAIFGGLTPIFVSLLIPYSFLAPAYYVAILGGLGFLVGSYLTLKK
jgi:MFS family permease